MLPARAIAAEGGKADIAKPFKGVDGGVFEIAVRHRGDAFRILYAVKMGADIWYSCFSEEIQVRHKDAHHGS